MKILISTDCYLFNLGGIAASVLALCSGLRHHGHEVKTLSLSNCNHSFRDRDDYYIKSAPALYYPDMRISFAMREPLLKELEEWQPDIIHIQTEGTARRMALKINKHCRAPIVMTCHTDYGHFIFHKLKTTAPVKILMRIAGKILYSCADIVTAPSQKAAAFPFLDTVRDRLVIIPNGTEINKYQKHFTEEERRKFRASLGIDDHAGVLVMVTRLSKEKNIQELISFLPGLLKKVPNTKYLIVGDGPYAKRLVKLTERLRISDSVIFAGRIPSQHVWQYYDAGDLFVSASTFESLSMSCLEALANGLPMLCRADDALTGILEHQKNGMIYHSETEFVDFAARILCNQKLRADMGQFSTLKSADFTGDAFAAAMLSVYENAIAERKIRSNRERLK